MNPSQKAVTYSADWSKPEERFAELEATNALLKRLETDRSAYNKLFSPESLKRTTVQPGDKKPRARKKPAAPPPESAPAAPSDG